MRRIDRHLLTVFLLANVIMAVEAAPRTKAPPTVTTERFFELETLPLWEGPAPGAVGDSPADVPSVTVVRPWAGKENGAAVIVAPGGSYAMLAASLEGRQVADWFAVRGITAFVINYRLGARYPYPVPLQDAQRGLRFVRANAARWRLAHDRIGMVGFSAGGHLAAMTATSFHEANPAAPDPVERETDRPDFIVLGYPALGWMETTQGPNLGYCVATKIPDCQNKGFERYNPAKLVRADSPTTFIFHTGEDPVLPEYSLKFVSALREKGVPVELHLFARGPHGVGLGAGDPSLDIWPELLEHWLRKEGLLSSFDKAVVAPAASNTPSKLHLDSPIRALWNDPRARQVLQKNLPRETYDAIEEARESGLSLGPYLRLDLTVTQERLDAIAKQLAGLASTQ